MHDEARDLMIALAASAALEGALADNLAAIAFDGSSTERAALAPTLQTATYIHRVKALELQARLAALVECYGALHLEQRRP